MRSVLLSIDPQPAITLAVGAITAAQLALDACQKIADILARRHTSAIEASGNGEALDVNSLYGALAMMTGHKRDTTTHADALTVYQSNGTTELARCRWPQTWTRSRLSRWVEKRQARVFWLTGL